MSHPLLHGAEQYLLDERAFDAERMAQNFRRAQVVRKPRCQSDRFDVAPAGRAAPLPDALMASVIARVPRRETTWLFLDAGVYNGLFEAMAYQGTTRYVVAAHRPSNTSGEALFALAGPAGDSPDVITREALLPADMDVGDKLIARNAGAYSLSVTSEFNGFPKPPAYVV